MSERIHYGTMVVAALSAVLSTSACAINTKYQRPEMPIAPAYRESLPAGWTNAQPSDTVERGRWWDVYKDSGLDALEEQVSISNQNVLAAEAQFREARAAVGVSRAGQFPTVDITPSAKVSGTGAASVPSTRNSQRVSGRPRPALQRLMRGLPECRAAPATQ